MRSYSSILATRLLMVWKLVSMPPSHRWLMYGMPHFSAYCWIGSCACFFVPMKRIEPPPATVSRTKVYAVSMRASVCSRSMM